MGLTVEILMAARYWQNMWALAKLGEHQRKEGVASCCGCILLTQFRALPDD